jgi:hypothetical protein
MEHVALGYAAWAAVKWAGYFGVARSERFRALREPSPRPAIVASVRVAIGLLGGVLLFSLAKAGALTSGVVVVCVLVPARWSEWWLTIRLLYGGAEPVAVGRAIRFGTLVSFVIDVPALVLMFVAGGAGPLC